jgi:hypothetical protein
MKPAPLMIGTARVVAYTVIDSRHSMTRATAHVVAGGQARPAAGLAICQDSNDSSFYLFGCDKDWAPITDTWHESFEGAKWQAEFEYAGSAETWQHAG